MPETTPETPVGEPLPVRDPGATLRRPRVITTERPTFHWADPDTRPAAWRAFGEPTEQGEQ
jgi:hypothetical protein